MKKSLITLAFIIVSILAEAQEADIDVKFEDAIPVLNMGTFHMGYTPDANSTEFDEHDEENIREVHRIAKAIAAFKPTVIVVERQPKYNKELQQSYAEYLQHPDKRFEEPSEIELLAFEVGQLSGAKRIYGIDYQEGYNYRIAREVNNGLDTETYQQYMKEINQLMTKYPEEEMTVGEKLMYINHPQYQDILMNINADMLTHISSVGDSEGADEAAKFYHRNLVMYSNLNQIGLSKEDRVFILMGGTHTAFFKPWLERSPKYKPVDLEGFLRE